MEEWLPYQERDDEAVAFVREMIENNGLTYSDLIAVSPYITLDGSRISGKLPKDGNGPESVKKTMSYIPNRHTSRTRTGFRW